MGFDLSFTLSRAEPLSPQELDVLERHLRTWRRKIIGYDWHVPREAMDTLGSGSRGAEPDSPPIAWGRLRPTRGEPGVSDQGGYLDKVVEQVHTALAEVRGLVPGAALAFADDFGAFAWTSIGFNYSPQAALPAIPRDADAWSSLAALREIPEGRAAAGAAKAPRAARGTKAEATAALAQADRASLIERVLAPKSRELTDRARTAAIELLCADPDPAAAAALVERIRRDVFRYMWTDTVVRALAASPRRCSWATALMFYDRGWTGAADLVIASVTEEAIPHLARAPRTIRWNAMVLRALDVLDSPASLAAARERTEQTSSPLDAADLAVVAAVLAAQRALAGSSEWSGGRSPQQVLDADPAVRAALQQVTAALAALAAAGGEPAEWLAHRRGAGTKALSLLDGKRVTRDALAGGLAALADYAVTRPPELGREQLLCGELSQLELEWLARHGQGPLSAGASQS